jgi:uncharacterized membrane protein
MRTLRALLTVAYPFAIYAALHGLGPRSVALCFAAIVALRAALTWRRARREDLRRLLVPALLLGLVPAGTLLAGDPRFLLLVPALVNGALLVSFGRTLFGGPTLVESFARMQVGDLPEDEVLYCRHVTLVWCAFFAVNGAVSLWLARRGDLAAWTLYTGGISYLLVGLLFASEFLVRCFRFGRYEGTLVEPLFRRLFRARPAA